MNFIVLKRNALAFVIGGAAGPFSVQVAAGPVVAPVTHGVSAGDATADSVVIWSRTDQPAYMHVVIEGQGNASAIRQVVEVIADDDFAGKVRITGLESGTEYRYKVWFSTSKKGRAGVDTADEGRFRTAPATKAAQAVRFGWGGDLAGQNVCRDAVAGFPIFNAINAARLDFFIGLGDMIYADGVCKRKGRYGNTQAAGRFEPAATLPDFWAHWKYNREDRGYRRLLAGMPYYAIWDDHEVVNDFGPLHDTRTNAPYTLGMHLIPMGLKAMLDYNPILPAGNTPERLYRSIRWGKHVEMFILDTRQYRDANFVADNPRIPKTMLGREQAVWLKDALKKSDATWKIIVSSVPMSIPTGSPAAAGRDGWANYRQPGGFEYELTDILRYLQQNGMYNVVWITTDVHFSEVFRYAPFQDDASFRVHEIVAGPLNAGIFPKAEFDTTLRTESLFRFPTATPADYAEAKRMFNFGLIEIVENGKLVASINDLNGVALYELVLDRR
ncbi:MAG: alkaline phosphatase D family protein [Gammaproteobacteria bacterium]